MAEVAGLALGAVSIAGLFTGCVELAEYISLSRNLGSDYEALYTKFILLKARFVACGQHLKLMLDHPVRDAARDPWQYGTIRCLTAIKSLLINAQELQQKYRVRQNGGCEVLSPQSKNEHPAMLCEIEQALQMSAENRQQKIWLGRKFGWALRDKKAFDRLIGDLAFHVDELERLISSVPFRCSVLEDAASVPNMREPTAERRTQPCAEAANQGHTYLRNQIKDRARVFQGDVGDCGTYGRQHTFEDNRISGESNVVQGNVAYDFMADFWKD